LIEQAKDNPKVCLSGLYSGRLFWIKALFQEKFSDYPAIKLYGELDERREATEAEIERLKRRMKITNVFGKAEKVDLGKMTDHL